MGLKNKASDELGRLLIASGKWVPSQTPLIVFLCVDEAEFPAASWILSPNTRVDLANYGCHFIFTFLPLALSELFPEL